MIAGLLTDLRLIAAAVVLALVAFGGVALYHAGKSNERTRQQVATAAALVAKDAAERELANRTRILTDAHTAEIARRDRAAAAVRADLERLRRAVADARPAPASRGRPADEAPVGPGELLAACAGELAQMGDDARGLAAQVIGLQAYARLAQEACGR